MNKLSYRILYFLDRNGRVTLSKIAKSLKTSEQRISYAVKSMIKKKQIKFYSTVFDYSKFDFVSTYRIWDAYDLNFSLQNMFDQNYEEAWQYSTMGRSLNFGIKRVY